MHTKSHGKRPKVDWHIKRNIRKKEKEEESIKYDGPSPPCNSYSLDTCIVNRSIS